MHSRLTVFSEMVIREPGVMRPITLTFRRLYQPFLHNENKMFNIKFCNNPSTPALQGSLC